MAVIGIPCNSDFDTSNKIGTNWGARVVTSSDFWARNGRHAVSSGSKKLLVRPVGRTHKECRHVILVPSS